jgi:hypothetical protein
VTQSYLFASVQFNLVVDDKAQRGTDPSEDIGVSSFPKTLKAIFFVNLDKAVNHSTILSSRFAGLHEELSFDCIPRIG